MLVRSEVDGVPVLFAQTEGPTRGGLMFRVGRADETLARGGITHLIEHLALHKLGVADYHYNGSTGQSLTAFYSQGDEDDVLKYLDAVCAGLRDLPLDRMAIEKSILNTEQKTRGTGAVDQVLLWRYGAQGHGLVAYPEFGLEDITAAETRAWCDEWFTRENAALWFAGERLPSTLKLDLPSGSRKPYPERVEVLPRTPAYFCSDAPFIAFDSVVPRSAAASVFGKMLERELFRLLRSEGGLSYTVEVAAQSDGSEQTQICVVADALPEKQSAVLGAFLDAMRRLAAGTILAEDLASAKAVMEKDLSNQDVVPALLMASCVDLLNGREPLWLDERRERLRGVQAEHIQEVAKQALARGVLMLPHGLRADWAGFAEAPAWSPHAAEGKSWKSRDYPLNPWRLIVGAAAVSTVNAEGKANTVYYSQCRALLCWPDGARQLFGPDGTSVRVEPTMWQVKPEVLKMIDASVPAGLRVTMQTRRPEELPRPRVTWWMRVRWRMRRATQLLGLARA